MHVEKNVPLAPLTTFKIGGKARYFFHATSAKDLSEAADFAKKEKLPLLFLGGGSNMLISDKGFKGLVVKVDILGVEFFDRKGKTEVVAGAGEDWDVLVSLSVDKGLFGVENLSGIPGTVGAAPVQNIGAYGTEISESLLWVEVFDTKTMKIKKLSRRDCAFGYRDSVFKHEGSHLIVTKVSLTLSKEGSVNLSYRDVTEYFKREKIQKPGLKEVRSAILEIRSRKFPNLEFVGTAGSFFKNPVISRAKYESLRKVYPELSGFPSGNAKVKLSLAWIIDHICKLKDLRVGESGVAPNQTLVLCNFGNASAQEIKILAERISKKVLEKTGITIEPEVRIVE